MKKITIAILMFSMVIFTSPFSQLCHAEGKLVTSKILTVNDVQSTVNSSLYDMRLQVGQTPIKWKQISEMQNNSLKIFGVHQEGNSATIYCRFMAKVWGGPAGQLLPVIAHADLVRLNSGKWLNLADGKFLMSK